MKICRENGCLEYTVAEDEIILENIKVYQCRKGTGTELINQLKQIACDLNLPINLYAYPQDDTISEEELKLFYEKNGFDLSADDVDGRLYTY